MGLGMHNLRTLHMTKLKSSSTRGTDPL